MKGKNNDKNIRKVGYELPAELCDRLKQSASENDRSINYELANILKNYFKMPIRWEPWIVELIEKYAKRRKTSVSYTVNNILAGYFDEYGDRGDNIIEQPKNSFKTA